MLIKKGNKKILVSEDEYGFVVEGIQRLEDQMKELNRYRKQMEQGVKDGTIGISIFDAKSEEKDKSMH